MDNLSEIYNKISKIPLENNQFVLYYEVIKAIGKSDWKNNTLKPEAEIVSWLCLDKMLAHTEFRFGNNYRVEFSKMLDGTALAVFIVNN